MKHPTNPNLHNLNQSQLPTLQAARDLTGQLHNILWPIVRKTQLYYDYWENSTKRRSVREIRMRIAVFCTNNEVVTPELQVAMDQATKLLESSFPPGIQKAYARTEYQWEPLPAEQQPADPYAPVAAIRTNKPRAVYYSWRVYYQSSK